MNERIKKADSDLLEEDIREIFARVFEDNEPTDFDTVISLLGVLMGRITRHFAGRACEGNETAFTELFFLAANATRLYQRLLEDNPEAHKRHAIYHETIPVLVGRSGDTIEKAISLVKLTGVGDRIGLANKGRQKYSIFREIAEELIREILRDISRIANLMSEEPFFLPELSREKKVLETWWPEILKRFEEQYGPEIENHPSFASWRNSKSDRYNPDGKTDSVLRADLKTQLKQAFKHIAGLRDDRGRLLQ